VRAGRGRVGGDDGPRLGDGGVPAVLDHGVLRPGRPGSHRDRRELGQDRLERDPPGQGVPVLGQADEGEQERVGVGGVGGVDRGEDVGGVLAPGEDGFCLGEGPQRRRGGRQCVQVDPFGDEPAEQRAGDTGGNVLVGAERVGGHGRSDPFVGSLSRSRFLTDGWWITRGPNPSGV